MPGPGGGPFVTGNQASVCRRLVLRCIDDNTTSHDGEKCPVENRCDQDSTIIRFHVDLEGSDVGSKTLAGAADRSALCSSSPLEVM